MDYCVIPSFVTCVMEGEYYFSLTPSIAAQCILDRRAIKSLISVVHFYYGP